MPKTKALARDFGCFDVHTLDPRTRERRPRCRSQGQELPVRVVVVVVPQPHPRWCEQIDWFNLAAMLLMEVVRMFLT